MYTPPPIHGDFICNCCGRRKDVLKYTYEAHGEPVLEDWCSCGGTFDDAVECSYCGKIVAKGNTEEDGESEYVCRACQAEQDERISRDRIPLYTDKQYQLNYITKRSNENGRINTLEEVI